MTIFDNYAARYERTREEEYSLTEYLALCKKDRLTYASAPERMLEWGAAVTAAMLLTLIFLAIAERAARMLGERGLLAIERLMGLLLTAIAVEMLLHGIEGFVRQLSVTTSS